MSPLKEIIDAITSLVSKVEDDLKVRGAEYNNVRSQLNAINRKQSGSLAVRDLSNIVKPDDVVNSEHLTTFLAFVPKYSQKDWLTSYETLTQYVSEFNRDSRDSREEAREHQPRREAISRRSQHDPDRSTRKPRAAPWILLRR